MILQAHNGPITSTEISIAAILQVLNPETAAEYLQSIENKTTSLVDAFCLQNERAEVSLSFNHSLYSTYIEPIRMLNGTLKFLSVF